MLRRSAKLKMMESAKGFVRPEPYSFEWKIERFFADCAKLGEFYRSPVCSIPYADKITNWHLEVYPKGTDNFKDHVALYIYFESIENIELTVDFQCSILNEQGIPAKEDKENCTFKSPLDNWGWGDFIKQDFIKDAGNGVLIDDTLTIKCEIRFQPANQEFKKNFHGYDEWVTKIGEGFADYDELLERENYTDVTFTVQDKKINGHKAILSLKSPVLKDIFLNQMEERVINVTDISYDVIRELFRFIYSKKVRNIEQIASDLLIAADKYQVIELKALCEKTLYDKLSVDNVIEYLKLTEMCNTIHLKRLVIKFIGANLKDVIQKPAFANLNSKVMYEVMQAIAEKIK